MSQALLFWSLAPLRVIVDRGKVNGEACMQPLQLPGDTHF